MAAREKRDLTAIEVDLVEGLAAVLTSDQIADRFGISRASWYRLLERRPDIKRRYQRGKAYFIESCASQLKKKVMEGNLTAIIFALKTQGGWRETQAIDHTSSDGSMGPVGAIDVQIIDPGEKEKDDETRD